MLRNGAKIENVSRMLGHTNIVQTQRYAKVLAKSVHDDLKLEGITNQIKNETMKKVFVIAALAMVFASCGKDVNVEENGEEGES